MVPILDDRVGKTLALPSRWQTLVLRHRFLCPNFGATVVLVALSFGVYRVRDPPYRFPATGFIALQNSLMDGEMKASMHADWRDLYRAALFEPDKSKTPIRIADAEKKITDRARELSYSGDHGDLERSELNVASYALVALRSWLEWNGNQSDTSHRAVA
jgi:hypothetical protein